MASGALPPGFPAILIDGEYYWDGGIASNTPLDYVLDEETDRDLLIFQVDLFSARGDLPETLLEAAEREKDIRFSSRTRMNTDKNRQIHNARKAVRDLISKLPDNLQNDPSVEFLREAAKENTVTVVHLIYKSKNYEILSKDYDFSHVGVVEHWNAGVRDVHLSMRHKEWLERPQSGETMVTYDLTGDENSRQAKRSEEHGYADRQERSGDRLDQRHWACVCARFRRRRRQCRDQRLGRARRYREGALRASRPISRSRRSIRRPT